MPARDAFFVVPRSELEGARVEITEKLVRTFPDGVKLYDLTGEPGSSSGTEENPRTLGFS